MDKLPFAHELGSVQLVNRIVSISAIKLIFLIQNKVTYLTTATRKVK
jgi:hypothetical protein